MRQKVKSKSVHYELHGQNGASWSVLGIFDDQSEAKEQAEKIYRAGTYRAVRVLRERYEEDSGDFNSLELLFLGRKVKPSKYDDDELAVFCRKPEELYSSESRRLIARLLATVLDGWDATPLELLHDPALYTRLQNTGTHLLKAVQNLSVAQVRKSGEPVAERIRANFAVIDKAAAHVQRCHAGGLPSLADKRLADAVQLLEDRENRRFLLSCVLAADLQSHKGGVAKVDRLIALIRLDHPEWVMRTIDAFLSEQLMHRRLMRALFPDEDATDFLEKLAALSRGHLPEEGQSPMTAMLNGFLAANVLPACRTMLISHIRHELTVGHRLTKGDLQDEFCALWRLGDGIGDGIDAELSDKPLDELLEGRTRRLLNPQTLGEYIATGHNPADKLQKLIDLERFCIGSSNKRMIANYMMPLLSDAPNEEFWLTPLGTGYAGRMRLLTRLQKRLIVSHLQDLPKNKLTERLDVYCLKLLENSKIFDRLAKSEGPSFDKAQRILRMLADGYFTHGEARALAEAEARRYMAEKDFLLPLTKIPKGSERLEAVQRLKKLMASAGLPDMDRF
ncbi:MULTISPECIES: hypothetical protein [unclassified Iodidimonas]|uniref:hypothetical protein n=1 Tax=unclassified Iodidimonas TaxID=2626145 RepID=UPI0024829B0E|nr:MULTISPECIES: hypothetical protein [unclassified Iodidimonas]